MTIDALQPPRKRWKQSLMELSEWVFETFWDFTMDLDQSKVWMLRKCVMDVMAQWDKRLVESDTLLLTWDAQWISMMQLRVFPKPCISESCIIAQSLSSSTKRVIKFWWFNSSSIWWQVIYLACDEAGCGAPESKVTGHRGGGTWSQTKGKKQILTTRKGQGRVFLVLPGCIFRLLGPNFTFKIFLGCAEEINLLFAFRYLALWFQ